jgi:hypothetical protein
VLLSTLLHAILHPSHHLLNVLLQIANKLGLSNKIKLFSNITATEHQQWQTFHLWCTRRRYWGGGGGGPGGNDTSYGLVLRNDYENILLTQKKHGIIGPKTIIV